MKTAIWLTVVAVTELAGLLIRFAQAMTETCGPDGPGWECSEQLGALAAIFMIGVPILAAWDLLFAGDAGAGG